VSTEEAQLAGRALAHVVDGARHERDHAELAQLRHRIVCEAPRVSRPPARALLLIIITLARAPKLTVSGRGVGDAHADELGAQLVVAARLGDALGAAVELRVVLGDEPAVLLQPVLADLLALAVLLVLVLLLRARWRRCVRASANAERARPPLTSSLLSDSPSSGSLSPYSSSDTAS
jgi:hypothetical protein